ncbi:MAG TPA: LysE family transporter [Pyrinomonadaceae bacterium]|jgi:RhtB (resistance to homoserine/threonine) family protein
MGYLLLSLMAVDLLAAISPGPNFVVVTQTAIRHTRRRAIAVVLGIVTANLIWCGAVVFGLAALFKLAPWLYGVIKFTGGAYLIYLGVCLWRNSGSAPTPGESPLQSLHSAAFVRGLLTNLSNPKSVVYFGSIFALFMGPDTPAWTRAGAVGIVIFDTVLWYGTVAILFSSRLVQSFYVRVQRPINRVAGAAMIGFGGKLMLVRD